MIPSNPLLGLESFQSNHAIQTSVDRSVRALSHSRRSFFSSHTSSPALRYLRRKVIEDAFDGCADTARDRTDSAISARAFAAFFALSGTAEIEWDSKLSQDCTEGGSPRSFSSSPLIASCLDVRIGASGSGSSSVDPEDSPESETNSSLSSESTAARIVVATVRCWETGASSLRRAVDLEDLPVRRRKSPPSSSASRVLVPGNAETGRGGCSRRRLALGSVRDICYSQNADETDKISATRNSALCGGMGALAMELPPSGDLWLILGRSGCPGCSSSRPRDQGRGPSRNCRLEHSLVALDKVLEGRTRD